MRDLPGPGLEPVSPALAGGFLTTVPPGKSQAQAFEAVTLLQKLASLLPLCSSLLASESEPQN